jgi:hypothetical protein
VNQAAWPLVTLKENRTAQDPHVIDRANETFELRKNSPAFKLGFKPIPLKSSPTNSTTSARKASRLLERLTWSNVHRDHIEIGRDVSEGGRRLAAVG